MRYVIHRGRHEIGGMCIEVAADDGTRVLLDLGMPLTVPGGGDYPWGTEQRPTAELLEEGILRRVPGLLPGDPTAPNITAIILTHSHLDHYGLAHHAHPDIPVYGSEGTLAILGVGRVFFPDARLPAQLVTLPNDQPVHLGGLTVTAVPVDHSAPDSRALLCEADGQRLLYSGDLRAHGRTGFRFENMLRDERLRGVDWLLLEGTTLGPSGQDHGLKSEADVEERLVELTGGEPDKLLAVAASGQNLDRLVSCFRAARRGGRLLVVDAYQAYVLMQLEPLSKNIPQVGWDGIRVSFSPHQVERLKAAGLMDLAREMSKKGRVSSDELAGDPGRYLLCMRASYRVTKLLDKIGPERITLAWSMWGGYWRRDRSPLRKWAEAHDVGVDFVHSGGHAWPEDLNRLEDALAPKEVIRVHTEPADPA